MAVVHQVDDFKLELLDQTSDHQTQRYVHVLEENGEKYTQTYIVSVDPTERFLIAAVCNDEYWGCERDTDLGERLMLCYELGLEPKDNVFKSLGLKGLFNGNFGGGQSHILSDVNHVYVAKYAQGNNYVHPADFYVQLYGGSEPPVEPS